MWQIVVVFVVVLLPCPATGRKAPEENCTEIERRALLDFKMSVTSDPSGVLHSWNIDSTHHCNWTGITCSGDQPEARVIAVDLGSLGLAGRIAPSIGNLTNLERLDLSSNVFSGVIPPAIGRLRGLLEIDLWENSITGEIPEEIGLLKFLQILGAYGNNLAGSLPRSLLNLSSLTVLDLTDNDVAGSFPADIGFMLPELRWLTLDRNHFSGDITALLSNASTMETVSMVNNRFSGHIPSRFGKLACRLRVLDLYGNALVNDGRWEFIESLANCSNLRFLGVGRNRLTGTLPESIGRLSPELRKLEMIHIGIEGEIPAEIGNLTRLNTLIMTRNFLTGRIPDSLGRLSGLQGFDLSANLLTGEIPASMGNMTQLTFMEFSLNRLQGRIPASLGNLRQLTFLSFANNSLVGEIPGEMFSGMASADFIYLSNNSLSGTLPTEVGRMRNLEAIAVNGNNLSGMIPATIAGCTVLSVLQLQQNSFAGRIPRELVGMKGLGHIDLSHNELTGGIPDGLGDLPFLFTLDLSFNRLEGEVPLEGVFLNASSFAVDGNHELCGGIAALGLPHCLNQSKATPPPKTREKSAVALVVSAVTALLLLFLLVFILFAILLYQQRRASPHMHSLENGHQGITYAELLKATSGFSAANLIGSGGHGLVYRGELEFGQGKTMVAVKVFDLEKRGTSKCFKAELEALTNFRHRNLVKIITFFSGADSQGNDFQAIAYEFKANGSLEAFLHPSSSPAANHMDGCGSESELSLIQRLNIAIDIAEALQYLHNGCQSSLAHCDLKPSNILLDDDMNACLADFGLARLVSGERSGRRTHLQSFSSIGIRGTIGYIAPEFGAGGRVSSFSDIYSFGILIFEMFTGRRPVDDLFKDGLSLRKFVETALPSRAMDIKDPRITIPAGDDDDDKAMVSMECLASVLRVGLMCSKECPIDRLAARDAAAELHSIRSRYLANLAVNGSEKRSIGNGDDHHGLLPSSSSNAECFVDPVVLNRLICD